jgi:hypothetical protein
MSHLEIEIPVNFPFLGNAREALDRLVTSLYEISGKKPRFIVKEGAWTSVWNNFEDGKTPNGKPETENAFFVATVVGVVCFKKAS